jgi:hypothetical protein
MRATVARRVRPAPHCPGWVDRLTFLAMKSAEDIESYLLRMGMTYEKMQPGIWVLTANGTPLVVSIAGPVVAFRLKVMDVPPPGPGREELFRKLLSLNTTEMIHGAYGLEGEAVVVVHALELENLDLNEFQAVVDDMSMGVAKHQAQLTHHAGPSTTSASAH